MFGYVYVRVCVSLRVRLCMVVYVCAYLRLIAFFFFPRRIVVFACVCVCMFAYGRVWLCIVVYVCVFEFGCV